MFLRRGLGPRRVFALFSFGGRDSLLNLPLERGLWTKLLDSEDPKWKLKAPALDSSAANGLPRTILSEGTVTLVLRGRALALFVLKEEQ